MDRKAKKRKLAAEAATMSVEELQRILQQRNRDKLTLEVFKRELVRRNILDAFCKDIYVPKESASGV